MLIFYVLVLLDLDCMRISTFILKMDKSDQIQLNPEAVKTINERVKLGNLIHKILK